MDPLPVTPPADAAPTLPQARDMFKQARAVLDARRQRPGHDLSARQEQLRQRFADWLSEPVPADAPAHIATLIRRASAAGEFIAHIYRFPSEYCHDRGRAVNNDDPEWPASLQGPALGWHQLLHETCVPMGFHIGAQVVTWPALMPGDISLFLSWQD